MRLRPPIVSALLVLVAASSGLPESKAAATPAPTERQKIVHALNRLAYGPRPGDVERVQRTGLDAWIDQQLHPERIDDDAVDARIKTQFPTLEWPARKLLPAYYEEIRGFLYMQQASGDTEDFKLRTGVDIKKRGSSAGYKAPEKPGLGAVVKMFGGNVTLRALTELQVAKLIRAAESERQLNEVMVDFWSNHFNVDVKKDACRIYRIVDDRDVIRPRAMGKFRHLLGAVAASPGMLTYLDNWQNSAPHTVGVIEQHIRSVAIEQMIGIEIAELKPEKKARTEGGINENFARELLELHTLGVDGGYTQKDVEEVARCFTGWSVNPFLGTFTFEARKHDDGPKTVLGHAIPAGGGIKDGTAVLDILAKHPSTARFVATKLCRRFIADDPPAAAVERAVRAFAETDGDIREVVRAIVTSPEFFAPAALRAKIKSPLEFAVSAVRAAGGRVEPRGRGVATLQVRYFLEGAGTSGFGADRVSAMRPKTLNWHVYDMGQPLFACQPPTGYPEDSRKWVSPGALVSRMNFALDLASGEGVMDVTLPENATTPRTLETLIADVLHGEASPQTRATLEKQAKEKSQNPGRMLALVLASPEFQRR